MSKTDIRKRLGLRSVININGPMTSLGACRALPVAIQAAIDILPCFVEINDLHAKASASIAKSTGAEAGMVTACASAGITLAIAGAMTGSDLAKIEQLPDTEDMKNEVVIQKGHDIGYGAPIEQSIRLAGAKPIHIGNVLETHRHQLDAKLNERTAAALYVISFHTVQYGQLPLADFIDICHKKNVPVIVDMANEQDMHSVLDMGADIVIFSAHKFLRGLTAGIVAGKEGLVQATFFQNMGIGRGMKVGKESIVSTMAVLEAWADRDHKAIQGQEKETLALWRDTFSLYPGVHADIIPDPTGNPIQRFYLPLSWSICRFVFALG